MLAQHHATAPPGVLPLLAAADLQRQPMVSRHGLGSAITVLQRQGMASQLIAHTARKLHDRADRLARDAVGGDEGGETFAETAPLRPDPLTQDQMVQGSIELL